MVGGPVGGVEVPTVARDIIYGWARGLVGTSIQDFFAPEEFTHKAGPAGSGRVGGSVVVFCCDVLRRPKKAIFTLPQAYTTLGLQDSAWIQLPKFRSMIE